MKLERIQLRQIYLHQKVLNRKKENLKKKNSAVFHLHVNRHLHQSNRAPRWLTDRGWPSPRNLFPVTKIILLGEEEAQEWETALALLFWPWWWWSWRWSKTIGHLNLRSCITYDKVGVGISQEKNFGTGVAVAVVTTHPVKLFCLHCVGIPSTMAAAFTLFQESAMFFGIDLHSTVCNTDLLSRDFLVNTAKSVGAQNI